MFDDFIEKMIFNGEISERKVVIFGAGGAGKAAYDALNGFSCKIHYFVDNNPLKWGDKFFNVDILNPNILTREDRKKIFIVVGSMYYDEIRSQLIDMNFEENRHFFAFLKKKSREILPHSDIMNRLEGRMDYLEKKLDDIQIYLRNIESLLLMNTVAPDGLPVPPMKLFPLVTGTQELSWYFEGGKVWVKRIIDILGKNELDFSNFKEILDFGCGCGRIIRHWNDRKGVKIFGTDYNPDLIKWCRRNLTFAQFMVNQLEPPLNVDDDKFDFVYVCSVFTHLPESMQIPWIQELSRILKTGGYLLITTHGEAYLSRLSLKEQQDFNCGKLVVQNEQVAGSNPCMVFHPVKYVKENLGQALEFVDFIQADEIGTATPSQDFFLFRKI
ncbi:MAG: hypothetical protein CSA23_03450 [Deltaproteobacteria bacterium]|nr:MAG: hypothetical protein CSA23_03450 [Deltaproteobacteria bacterium]